MEEMSFFFNSAAHQAILKGLLVACGKGAGPRKVKVVVVVVGPDQIKL